FQNQRTPPGGVAVTTRTSFPHAAELPFFMGAYQPDARPSVVEHANGAVAVESIEFGVGSGRIDEVEHLVDDGDPWLRIIDGELGVRSVTLRGLRAPLAPSEVCGAVIHRAEDS
ncbi:MAG: hypothetical protein AAFO29_18475, partial [Actinomycetota bacterium]